MRRPPLILALFLLATTVARADARQTHQVESGEYLGLIAERYGVTVAELESWNELTSDRIHVGQRLVVSPEPPADDARDAWETSYVVLRGDHLGRIAERVGMTREALEQANPDVRFARLRPGERLRLVGPTRVVDHVVRRGETLARLASRYEVRHLDLVTWNPVLRRRGLETGMTIRIYTDVRISRSESIGAPNEGTLANAERLPAHRAYLVRSEEHSFGTHETVQWIVEAFDAALDADPDMPRVRIHDLSAREGGELAGHRSHQSGRDADIAYFRKQCRSDAPCFMSRTRPEDLDAAHTFRVLRYWLERDLATAIFVDYTLQEPLYEYARDHGATEAQLERWFQYPRPASTPIGVIRHFPAHADHFHVRFTCPRGDDACTEAVRRAPPHTHANDEVSNDATHHDARDDEDATPTATHGGSARVSTDDRAPREDPPAREVPEGAARDTPARGEPVESREAAATHAHPNPEHRPGDATPDEAPGD